MLHWFGSRCSWEHRLRGWTKPRGEPIIDVVGKRSFDLGGRTMRASIMAMRRATRGLLLLAVVAGLAAGCGRHNVDDDVDPEADPYAPTPLTVENNHWLDIVIFVYHDGELSRVGTVTAASSTNFFLPSWMIGQSRNIRLLGDPIGSEASARTETIHIQPGQFIEWRLESQLARSTVAVY